MMVDAPPDDQSGRWWQRHERWRDRGWSSLRLVSAHTYNRVEGLPIIFGPSFGRDLGWGRLSGEASGIWRTAQGFAWNSDVVGHAVKARAAIRRASRRARRGAPVRPRRTRRVVAAVGRGGRPGVGAPASRLPRLLQRARWDAVRVALSRRARSRRRSPTPTSDGGDGRRATRGRSSATTRRGARTRRWTRGRSTS